MNIFNHIPRRFHPQWYYLKNCETKAERYFESEYDAFMWQVLEDIGPDSPEFTVQECDPEHVDPAKAESCTMLGSLQVRQWKMFAMTLFPKVVVIGIMIAVVAGAWKIVENGSLPNPFDRIEARR